LLEQKADETYVVKKKKKRVGMRLKTKGKVM